jgi:hypothetical protein
VKRSRICRRVLDRDPARLEKENVLLRDSSPFPAFLALDHSARREDCHLYVISRLTALQCYAKIESSIASGTSQEAFNLVLS